MTVQLDDAALITLAATQALEADNSPVPAEHAVLVTRHLRVADGAVVVVDAAGAIRQRFGRPLFISELITELRASRVIRYPS